MQRCQFLNLMAIYDLPFLVDSAIPRLLSSLDDASEVAFELFLEGLQQAAYLLDPSKNFRLLYLNTHQ